MGIITDLVNRVDELLPSTTIQRAVYDRIDSINEDSKNNYPLCVYRVVSSSDSNFRNTKHYSELEVEFFLSDLWYMKDTETLAQKKDSLDTDLTQLIHSIPDVNNSNRENSFELLNASSAEYGWEQHNDNLVVVKRTVTLRGFTCIERL
jgi:hypothetical protein